ncbi:MAG: carbohydrate kinase family protein [Actinomycetes bacterium]
MDPAPPAVVAVAGEAITDLVPAGADGLFRAAPGGSPANVAIGLARLDVPTRMLARLSSDVLGRRLRHHLDSNGVDLSHAVAAAEPSSLAIVALQPDGSADYDFRVDGTADWQWTDDELAGVLADVAALHVGSLGLTTPPGGAALRRLAGRAREAATVSFDPNVRPVLMGSPEQVMNVMDEVLAVADVVKVSADDLAWLAPGRGTVDVAAEWLARGPALVVVTRGGDGAVAVGRTSGEVARPGDRVDVADTVGAGDSFMSALLAGLHSRDLLGAAARDALAGLGPTAVDGLLEEAVTASAITCSRVGADPPSAAELAARLHA